MSNMQTVRYEHVKAITNTGNIIAMLNQAGIGNEKATEIAQAIDVELNAALDEKLNAEQVVKIVEEHLDDVATKEFVRAEIQEVRVEIQEVKAELKAEIQEVRVEIQEVKAELKAEIQEVRMELKAEIQEVKTEIQVVRTEIQEVRTDMQKGLRQNLVAMVGFMAIICGALYFALTHHL